MKEILGTVSYNLNERVLFDHFEFGDSFLFFYQNINQPSCGGGGQWKF